ncbi:MAG: isoleucine--tRNA ligase [Ignavibacteriae bacterium]|nr:isoleucine--tRNA ligase [Ignavibacteriota bacterium]
MYKSVNENIRLPEIEKEILTFWENNKVFEESVTSRSDKKTFTFYEGPPTANGLPGIHHVISRTVKDIVCRYKTMQGYRVHRKAGWDTHGLPVEVEVEKKLGLKSKDEIYKFGAIEFNNACKDSIFTYLEQWEDLTRRMGYWINLKDAYVTFHNEYIESVWWALKKFFAAGLIYKGFKIQPFCPICESPLSSHEVAQGYQELKEPSIYVKFKIKSDKYKDADFLVWTTTPWTLPSNVALCVNPKEEYALIETAKGDKLILAKKLINGKLFPEDSKSGIPAYNIIESFEGISLEYIEYEPLFNFFELEKKAYYVTTGDFVTMEDGTGIVHIAPAFGEDDYQVGLKYDLPLLQAVKRSGLFKTNCGNFANMNFKDADPKIIDDLKISGRLFKKEMFTHSYPHCWRHKVPLMYYATDSWFIKTTQYKDKMIALNNEINWNPEEFGTGRFGNWLEENKDWAISRNRFWGTPLPIWYYKDENDKEHYECIGSIEELKSKSINFEDIYSKDFLDLHKPYIDRIELKSKDGHDMQRVPEVIDCWFDSGSMPFAQFHYPFENKEYFEANYPADFIAEGVDQTRGWFYSLHAIGSFLFDKPAYKNLVVNGHILDKFAKKMSKSLGNVVNPFEMMEKYGADILRWYLVAGSPIWKSKLFNEDDLIDIKNKFFDTLLNTYKFFIMYANITDFDYNKSHVIPVKERKEIDRWIISKLNSLKKEYYAQMDDYEITKACRLLSDFTIDEISNWYVRRNRRRFRTGEDKNDNLAAFQTLYECLHEIIMMLAPVSPFLSEKIFLDFDNYRKSIHLSEFSKFDRDLIDIKLEEQMDLAQRVVNVVRAVRVKNNLKVRQPLKQLLIPVLNEQDKENLKKVEDIILEEINVRNLNIIEGNSEIIRKKSKPNFKSIGPKYGKDVKKVQQIINGLTHSEITELEANDSLEKDSFNLTKDDVEIFTENIEGWIVETDGNLTIALDTKLDSELISEGISREFVNRIQNYRKANNYNVNDRINVTVKTESEILDAIMKNFDSIKTEINCDKLSSSGSSDISYYETEINDIPCNFYIEKIS